MRNIDIFNLIDTDGNLMAFLKMQYRITQDNCPKDCEMACETFENWWEEVVAYHLDSILAKCLKDYCQGLVTDYSWEDEMYYPYEEDDVYLEYDKSENVNPFFP